MFRVHPYGAGVFDANGFTQGPRLPIELVHAFYDIYYRPERVAVVVAGAIEPDQALDSIWVAFGGLERGKEAPPLPAGAGRRARRQLPLQLGARAAAPHLGLEGAGAWATPTGRRSRCWPG